MISKAVPQISLTLILTLEIIILRAGLFKVKIGTHLRVQAPIKLVQISNL